MSYRQKILSRFWIAGLLLIFVSRSDAQGLVGMADELTKSTVEGTILSVARNGRIRVKTENGVAQIEPIPDGFNLGLNIQISVSGTEKPTWLKKGQPLFVTGTVDKRNRFTEPVKELFVFSPSEETVWGFEEQPEAAEGDTRPVSLSAFVVAVKEDFVIARYPVNQRASRRVEIPFVDEASVKINASDLSYARPGDAIRATGYTVKEPLMLALNINITRKSKVKPAGNKTAKKGDGNKKGENGKGENGKGKMAGKQDPENNANKKGEAGGVDGAKKEGLPNAGSQPGNQVAVEGDPAKKQPNAGNRPIVEIPKRRRHRAGRAIIIN